MEKKVIQMTEEQLTQLSQTVADTVKNQLAGKQEPAAPAQPAAPAIIQHDLRSGQPGTPASPAIPGMIYTNQMPADGIVRLSFSREGATAAETLVGKYSNEHVMQSYHWIMDRFDSDHSIRNKLGIVKNTLTSGATSGADTGGNVIPTMMWNEIIRKIYFVPSIFTRVTSIAVDAKIDFPLEGADVAWDFPGENTASSESDTSFGTVSIDVHEIIGRTSLSYTMLRKSPFDLVAFVTDLFANALLRKKNQLIVAGDGSGKPKGFRTETFSLTVAQADTAIADTDLNALYYKLPVQYRSLPGVAWVMADAVVAKLDGLKDDYGRPLLQPDMTAPFGYKLKGKDIVVTNDIPVNLGAGTNESEIFFGDLAHYIYNNGESMEMEASRIAGDAWPKNQLAIRLVGMNGGRMLTMNRMAKLTGVK